MRRTILLVLMFCCFAPTFAQAATRPGVPASVVVSPSVCDIECGDVGQFTATVYDSVGSVLPDARVRWEARKGGSISTRSGAFTDFTAGFTVGRFSPAVVASCGRKSGGAVVNVVPPYRVDVVISRSRATFSATASHQTLGKQIRGLGFVFSCDPGIGTIDPTTGAFLAATRSGEYDRVSVAAMYDGEPIGWGSFGLRIMPGPAKRIVVTSPAEPLPLGGSCVFTATVFDAYDNLIEDAELGWSLPPRVPGTITYDGYYEAADTAGTFAVKASSGKAVGYGSVTVAEHLPRPADYAEIRQLEADAESRLLAELNGGAEERAALSSVCEWANHQPVVHSAGYDRENYSLLIEFSGGRSALFVIGYPLVPEEPESTSLSTLPGAQDDTRIGAAILNCFDLPSPDVAGAVSRYGYVPWQPDTVMVADFVEACSYPFVYINTVLGAYYFNGGEDYYDEQFILTEEPVPAWPTEESLDSLAGQYWISGELVHFFRIAQEDGVFSSSCHYGITETFVGRRLSFQPTACVVLQADEVYRNRYWFFWDTDEDMEWDGDLRGTYIMVGFPHNDVSALDRLSQVFDSAFPPNVETPADMLSWAVFFCDDEFDWEILPYDPWEYDPLPNPIPLLGGAWVKSWLMSSQLFVNSDVTDWSDACLQFLPLTEDTDPNDPDAWANAVELSPIKGIQGDARFRLPRGLSSPTAAVRILRGGVWSNVKRVVLQLPSPTWSVGSSLVQFGTPDVVLSRDYDEAQLDMTFGDPDDPSVPSVQVSSPYWHGAYAPVARPCSVDARIDQDTEYEHRSGESDRGSCSTLYIVEWSGNRISGSVSGLLLNALDPSDTTLYPVCARFQGIPVTRTYEPDPFSFATPGQ